MTINGFNAALIGALAWVWTSPALAQPSPQEVAPPPPSTAVRLVEKMVAVTRLPDVYSSIMKYMQLLATPQMRLAQQQAIEAMLLPDEDAAAAKRVMDLFPLIAAAGQELEAGFSQHRAELIEDAAQMLTMAAPEEKQQKLLQLLSLKSVDKMFGVLYACLAYPPNWAVEDSQTVARFELWMQGVEDSQSRRPSSDGPAADVPPAQVSAARAILDDLMRLSRFEEAKDRVIPYLKETLIPRARWMSEIDRQKAEADIAEFERKYAGERDKGLETAAREMAAALSAEQLNELHDFLRTPTAAKVFDIIMGILDAALSINGADIDELQAFLDAEKETFAEGGFTLTPEERQALETQWQALSVKWLLTLSGSISAETRDKLIAAFVAMSMEAPR
ncbi:MAG: hypothetical protein NW215_02160 [Hyphomicrobiales bacterium]|nr:hypothetical protein [Hyphomicrobiales bacterium]